MSNHGTTLTSSTRVPIYVVASAISLAIYGTVLYMRLSSQLESAVTVQQAQDWLDDAREKNPGITWPRLPEKRQSAKQTDYTWEYPPMP